MKKRIAVAVCMVICSASVLLAEAPAGPPKPGPEHKRLDYFVGKWAFEGDMKESPMGPGGKMTGSDSWEWFTGGFHLVGRSEGKGPMGEIKGLSLLGYNAEDKVYAYYGIDSTGMGDGGKGTVQGDTWTWTGESKMGGKTMKSHYIIKELPPNAYSFKWELSVDNGPWSVVMEGKETRVK